MYVCIYIYIYIYTHTHTQTHTHTHTQTHVQIFIGDRLLSVGNTNVENLSIAGVRALIVGPPGSVLQLRLLRGGEVRTVRLARGAAGEFSGKHLQQLHLQQHMSQMASPQQPRRALLNMPNSNSSSNASDAPSTPTAPAAPPLVATAFNTPQPLPGHGSFPSPMREYQLPMLQQENGQLRLDYAPEGLFLFCVCVHLGKHLNMHVWQPQGAHSSIHS